MVIVGRLLAAGIGVVFLLEPSLIAYGFATGVEPDRPVPLTYMLLFAAIGALLSAGYFLIAVCANSLLSSATLRAIAGALLILPTLTAAHRAFVTGVPDIRMQALAAVALTLLLLSAFVWPKWLERSNSGVQPTPKSGAADAGR
jgi:hypothetical protein